VGLADAVHCGFEPDPARAGALDDRMHRELSMSLLHLAEATQTVLPEASAAMQSAAGRIASGERLPALAFATYFRIARALLQERREDLPPLVETLAEVPSRAPGLRIHTHAAPRSGPLLDALADPDAGVFEMAPVSPETAAAFGTLLDEGLALMARAIPELHGEVARIVREVLLAHAPPGRKMEFDGASHYQFWGLLMLNPKHHRTPLAVVEVLAHESAHTLLFGLTVEEPLVFNPDDELYPSPLRRDPRPMDGIYHATFVSARMAWAMERMAEDPALTPEERAAAAEAARTDRMNFASGLGVVDAHGRLSETGRAIMEGARAAMAAPAL